MQEATPSYLADELREPANFEARCRLRSASSSSLVIRRTRLSTVGDRAFPLAAARVWNSLPQHVTSVQSLPVFHSRLKTHLFRRCFPRLCCCAWEVTSSFSDTLIVSSYLLTYQNRWPSVTLNGPVAVIMHYFTQYGSFHYQLCQIHWSYTYTVRDKNNPVFGNIWFMGHDARYLCGSRAC